MKFLSSVVVLFAAGALASPMLEKRQNDACMEHATFKSCGSACWDTCSTPAGDFCTMQCVQGCYCDDGYIKTDDDQKCVKKEECPAA